VRVKPPWVPEAELGFAGLAAQAGVKSAVGSLWSVHDATTMRLMISFYGQLQKVPIKAEALRQAQLSLLKDVTPGNLKIQTRGVELVELPPGPPEAREDNFKHPYYWSGFTIVGSPW